MKRIFTAIFVAAMLMVPAVASASSSSCQAYNAPAVCNTSASRTTAASASTPTNASATANSLPFTGLDVTLLVAGGVTLLGAGLIVRKLSNSTE